MIKISNILRNDSFSSFFKRHAVLFIFIIFGYLVIIQHQFMGMYFDDYGYASLSYANPNFNISTEPHKFSDILEYLGYHYQNWGGRILFFFIEIVLLQGGIAIYALFQSIIIIGIFYLIYRIVKQNNTTKTRYDWLIALFSVTCYGLIGIMTFRDAVFWATASILYLIPIFFVLLFVFLHRELTNSKPHPIVIYVLMPLLAFVASFSQEQIGAAMFVYLFLQIAYDWITTKQRPKLWLILCATLSAVGLMALLLAPGSSVRMSTSSAEFYENNIIERITSTGLNITETALGEHNVIFLFLLMIFGLYLSSHLLFLKKQGKLIKSVSVALFITIGSILTFTLSTKQTLASFTENSLIRYSLTVAVALTILALVIHLLVKQKKIQLLILLLSGLTSQVVMLMAPYYPIRSFMFFLIVFFVISLSTLFTTVDLSPRKLLMLMMPLMIFSIYNYSTITVGYYKNSHTNTSNHRTLTNASTRLKQGEPVPEVRLKKLSDELYSQTMPYQDDYTLNLMRNYYRIPKDTIIIYE